MTDEASRGLPRVTTCIQTGRLHGSEDYRQTCFRAFSCVALTWNLYHFLHIYLQPSAWEKCKSLFPFLVFSFNVFLVLLPETAHWCTKLNKNVLASKTDFVAGEDYSKGKDHIQVIRATPPPRTKAPEPLTFDLSPVTSCPPVSVARPCSAAAPARAPLAPAGCCRTAAAAPSVHPSNHHTDRKTMWN